MHSQHDGHPANGLNMEYHKYIYVVCCVVGEVCVYIVLFYEWNIPPSGFVVAIMYIGMGFVGVRCGYEEEMGRKYVLSIKCVEG